LLPHTHFSFSSLHPVVASESASIITAFAPTLERTALILHSPLFVLPLVLGKRWRRRRGGAGHGFEPYLFLAMLAPP
jgi:hypothetical protein